MSYSSFTLEELAEKFKLKTPKQKLFSNVEKIEPSNWLKETLSMVESVPKNQKKHVPNTMLCLFCWK
jgi:hypothetical protein